MCQDRVISGPPGMRDAHGLQVLHAGASALFAKITGVVVGEAEHIEAGIRIMLCIAWRRPEQVAGLWVAAFLGGFAAFQQHAFQVAESNVGLTEDARYRAKKARAVIIGQRIFRVIGANHHVPDRGDADALV